MAEEESDVIGSSMLHIFRAAAQPMNEEKVVEFGMLKTDEQRIAFLLKLDHIHEILEVEAEYKGKDIVEAAKERENGNAIFSKKNYVSAIKAYNNAVRSAPCDKSLDASQRKEYLLSLANRSAALLHVKKFELCIRDIDVAVEEGYPENMQYKLYDRKGKALSQLRAPNQAMKNFEKAKKMLEVSNLDEKGKKLWTSTIDKQIKQCDKIIAEPAKNVTKEVPKVDGEVSETHLHASKAVDFKYMKEGGRHGVANKNIKIGNVLAQESGLSVVLLPDYYATHCYNCLTRCLAPLPDTRWSSIGYCSAECRQEAWDTYHKVEHPFQNLLGKEWCAKIGHLALRLALKVGYKNLKEYMLSVREAAVPEPEQKGFNQEGVYSDGYHSVYNMEVNMAKRLPEGIVDFGVFAIFLLKILQRAGFFELEEDTKIDANTKYGEELVLIGAALLRHLMVIQCNGISPMEILYPNDFEEPGYTGIGMGVYPTASLFNHSCDPNADLQFYGSKLVLRSTRNIRTGEDINIDYGFVFYKNPRAERQGKLQYRYCFQCECVACKDLWQLFRDLESDIPMFKCEFCQRALPMGNDMVDNRYIRCSYKKCNNLQDLTETVQKLQVSHDFYMAAMEEAIHGDKVKVIPQLESHMSLMQLTLLPPWRDLVTCQAAIRQCYRMQANVREII